eukprot:s290_g6.t1
MKQRTPECEKLVKKGDFYGCDLHNEQWEADIVVMLQWYDPRVSGLVPKDQIGRTLSEGQAQDLMWSPDVIVTNAELQGRSVISTNFHVSVDGMVNKTQRLLVKIKENFDGKEFPYDQQALHVLLASASYMTDDVQLVPMFAANLSDIGASSFDKSDWAFLYHDLKVFEESVGSLKKSRAQFVMHVLRDASPYMSSTIFPEIMIVVLSYTVFLFPVNPGFAMPRVSSAVIAFLSILTISTRTSAMLPEEALAERCREQTPHMDCQALTVIAAAHAKLLISDEALFQTLAWRLRSCARTCTFQAVANLANAYAKFGFQSPALAPEASRSSAPWTSTTALGITDGVFELVLEELPRLLLDSNAHSIVLLSHAAARAGQHRRLGALPQRLASAAQPTLPSCDGAQPGHSTEGGGLRA